MTDFTTQITNIDGRPEMRPLDGDPMNRAPGNWVPVTLGWLCRSALARDLPEDRAQPTGDQDLARIRLGLSIPDDATPRTLSAQEITMILPRVRSVFGGLLFYRAAELLDPESIKRK